MAAVIQESVQELNAQEGRDLLDRQARRYLGMSGEDFVRAWERGELDPPTATSMLPVYRC